MFGLPGLRRACRRVGPWLALLAVPGWLVVAAAGCGVDESGLGSMPKLSRDAGFDAVVAAGGPAAGGAGGSGGSGSGGAVIVTGSGGDQLGTGGEPDGNGDAGGTMGAGGAAGAVDQGTGGEGGAGGEAGTGAAGGAAGAGGMPATGGSGGAGGHAGSGGVRCNALNCLGCCAGTVCVTTPTAQQCGTRGAACTACRACQTCSLLGQCTVDPKSQWTIVAESAQVTKSPPGGGFWDSVRGDVGGSAPDLFCEYENPAGSVTPTTAGVTSTVTDVYSASWDQTITPAGGTVSASALMAARPAWRIWVGDEDCSTPNSCTSGQTACAYQQPISAATLMSGGLTVTNVQSCVSLNLLFVCASPTP